MIKKVKPHYKRNFVDYLRSLWGISLFYRLMAALIVLCIIAVVVYYVVISKYLNLSDKVLYSATKNCLTMINDNAKESFQLLDSETQKDYGMFTSKVVFHVRYANGSEAYIDCIFRKHLVGQKIQLERVNLVNEKGVIRVRRNIATYISN